MIKIAFVDMFRKFNEVAEIVTARSYFHTSYTDIDHRPLQCLHIYIKVHTKLMNMYDFLIEYILSNRIYAHDIVSVYYWTFPCRNSEYNLNVLLSCLTIILCPKCLLYFIIMTLHNIPTFIFI